MEVAQEHDGFLGHAADVLQHGDRLFLFGDYLAVGDIEQAGAQAPCPDREVDFLGGGEDFGLDALFFVGDEIQAGISGPEIRGDAVFHIYMLSGEEFPLPA